MSMPGRKYEAQSGYRYGFNGKEKDKDLTSLTAYDYGFRIYNPGIGKFLSVDPLTKDYPQLTPYQFSENQPIWSIDIDGLEKYIIIHYRNRYNQIYKTVIKGIRDIDTKEPTELLLKNALGDPLTTSEVYETNYYNRNGVIKDKGGRNATQTEKTIAKKAKAPNVKELETDEDLPYNKTIEESYLFETGRYSSRILDGEKFEYYENVSIFHLPEPKTGSYYNDFQDLMGGELGGPGGFDKSKAGILRHANMIIKQQIDLAISQFKDENKDLTVVLIDRITLVTNSETKNHLQNVAKEIERRLGVKVEVKVENNFIANGHLTGEGAYGVKTEVSGVK